MNFLQHRRHVPQQEQANYKPKPHVDFPLGTTSVSPALCGSLLGALGALGSAEFTAAEVLPAREARLIAARHLL